MQSRNVAGVYACNPRYTVFLEPYSLAPGEVGRDIYQPVVASRHRSARAARRAILQLISGRDNLAREYLRAVGPNVALRYVARETVAPFRAHSAQDLRAQY